MQLDVTTLVAKMLDFIAAHDELAFDIETSGLNPRKNVIMGFGIGDDQDGCYLPLKFWDGTAIQDVGVPSESIQAILQALLTKKIITWNGSFDIPFTKLNLGVDLLPALYVDGMLLKHTCDEEFPFGLKEVGEMVFGTNAKAEQTELSEHLKSKNAGPKDFYKADPEVLGKYCIKDCLLTYKLYNHYMNELERQSGL